jgi:hypothetical protein
MRFKAICFCAALSLAAGSAFAAGDTKKDTSGMKKDSMTMQECKDYMAMAKDSKSGMKHDAKKDAMCNDMMKKEGMASSDTMKGGTKK